LPECAITHDRDENDQQLAGDRDESDLCQIIEMIGAGRQHENRVNPRIKKRGLANCDWQAGRREGRNGDGLEAAGCLEHDKVGIQHLESRYEVVEPGASAWDGETLTTRTHGNIQAVLRYVDTDGDLLQGERPYLSELAVPRRRRWNGERGAKS